jgi:hypothetical protein
LGKEIEDDLHHQDKDEPEDSTKSQAFVKKEQEEEVELKEDVEAE